MVLYIFFVKIIIHTSKKNIIYSKYKRSVWLYEAAGRSVNGIEYRNGL